MIFVFTLQNFMTAPTPSPAAPEDFAPTNDTPVAEKTPEQKEALAELLGCGKAAPEEMSDAELVEAVAVEVMEWRRGQKRLGRYTWIKKGPDGRWPMPNGQWMTVVSAKWNPLSNWNDTMMVVERASQKHQFTLGNNYEHGWFARFSRPTMWHCKEFEEIGQNPKRAILIAALLAIRSQHPHD